MDENVKNAVIRKATFDTERGLSAWLQLEYGDGWHQGFGGFILYLPKDCKHHASQANFAGHFIYRVLEVAEVEDWGKLPGRCIRVRREPGFNGAAVAIGHIIKDEWFEPQREFDELRTQFQREGQETK